MFKVLQWFRSRAVVWLSHVLLHLQYKGKDVVRGTGVKVMKMVLIAPLLSNAYITGCVTSYIVCTGKPKRGKLSGEPELQTGIHTQGRHFCMFCSFVHSNLVQMHLRHVNSWVQLPYMIFKSKWTDLITVSWSFSNFTSTMYALSKLTVDEEARLCTSQTLQYVASSQAGHAPIPGHFHARINPTVTSPNGEGMWV